MSWQYEYTALHPELTRGGFPFWERTTQGITPRPPLAQGVIESWVVGGERSPGSIMVERLPAMVRNVRGLPIYYDADQGIWFVNGYPENFTSEAEATAYAESLVPAEGGTTPPPSTLPPWLLPLGGIGLLLLLTGR